MAEQPKAYIPISNAEVDPDSPVTSNLLARMRDNPIAIAQGATGAPRIVNNAFANLTFSWQKVKTGTIDGSAKILGSPVDASKLANASIGQSEIKETTLSMFESFAGAAVNRERTQTNSNIFWMLGYWSFASNTIGTEANTKFEVELGTGHSNSAAGAGNKNGVAQNNIAFLPYVYWRDKSFHTVDIFLELFYVQSSPPYNMGNGNIPLFVFAKQAPGGKITGMSIAEDPPWNHASGYNLVDGKRCIRRKILPEKDMLDPAKREAYLDALKNPTWQNVPFDDMQNEWMQAMPHGFNNLEAGERVVLIDPVSSMTEKLLALHQSREMPVASLFATGYLELGDDIEGAASPPGVTPVRCKWRHKG